MQATLPHRTACSEAQNSLFRQFKRFILRSEPMLGTTNWPTGSYGMQAICKITLHLLAHNHRHEQQHKNN